MKIGNFDLEKDGVYIIAELSANHNGSIDLAKKTIQAAKECGAHAIKLQTYRADTITLDCDNEDFIIKGGTLWDSKTLYELYEEAFTPWEWHQELFTYARELGIDIFSSPFDLSAVDFLEQFNPSAYKIASFEVTDYELVRYVASKKRVVIISTGVATQEEIQRCVEICKSEGITPILLKCTSSYPAPLEEANLITIHDMAQRFDCVVGFSDHTLGLSAPITAVSLGAKVIEKHFILDKSIPSADLAFSLDPSEFLAMAQGVKECQKLLGKVRYNKADNPSRRFARSLYASSPIKVGESFSAKNVKSVRPAYGLHPKYREKLFSHVATKEYKVGDRIVLEGCEASYGH